MKNEILRAFNEWQGENDLTEQDFNEFVVDNERTPYEIDNILNQTKVINFDYTTWLCDQNSDDVIIQVSVYLKGSMSLTIESYSEVPFTDLDSCVAFIENTNKFVEMALKITDYTDVSGEKTQIIIDHNTN